MRKERSAGFTLLELAIAVAIVGLLVAVAVGSYKDSQAQKTRAGAALAMQQLVDDIRKQQAASLSFRGARLPFTQFPQSGEAQYRFTLAGAPVQAADPAGPYAATTDLGFTLVATPTGSDSCGALLLDHNGRRGVTAGKVADCWR